MSNTLCPNCGGKGWIGDGTDGRHKCPDCTGKLSTPNLSGERNSCNCEALPLVHSHLEDDGKSYAIRPDTLVGDKTDDSLDNILYTFAMDYHNIKLKEGSKYAKQEIQALIQAERIKAKIEVLTTLINSAEWMDGYIKEGYVTVPELNHMLAELDTPNKDTK